MEVLVSLEELMMEFRNTVSILGSWLDKDTLIVLSKKILSRRSEIARFLYKPDVWNEPEDNWSNNSQCAVNAVNSGHGKAKEGNRSNHSQGAGKSGHRKAKENNKGKKNKGGKKKGKK
ncbi:hypothetical protein P8452_38892 [Trifolium repens]|nr:hypothetical protein P8452_38892 [Trifolium repens]